MHNKLFIGDNAIAITGGRNIGDPYFQASTELEFGDFDLAVAGRMVHALSHSFDKYWNDRLAIPAETLPLGKPTEQMPCLNLLGDEVIGNSRSCQYYQASDLSGGGSVFDSRITERTAFTIEEEVRQIRATPRCCVRPLS